MKNRAVGFLVVGIAILIAVIIFAFNRALNKIVNTSCSHGPTCPMWGTIDFQTYVSLGVMGFVLIVGLYLIFFGKEERLVTKIIKVKEQIQPRKVSRPHYQKVLADLPHNEKSVMGLVIDSEGSIMQSDLVEKSKLSKVNVTRVLDRLEGRGLIERKRRGMTNVVILK
ncbi:MAG: MarR family transcriptional regulator [Candidatus Woesearchaeota archaeon]